MQWRNGPGSREEDYFTPAAGRLGVASCPLSRRSCAELRSAVFLRSCLVTVIRTESSSHCAHTSHNRCFTALQGLGAGTRRLRSHDE